MGPAETESQGIETSKGTAAAAAAAAAQIERRKREERKDRQAGRQRIGSGGDDAVYVTMSARCRISD